MKTNRGTMNLASAGQSSNKTVLMFAYYFPPFPGISGVRSSKFSKYLPMNNWTPWVLTVDSRYYGHKECHADQIESQGGKISRLPYFYFPGNVLLVKILLPLWVLFFVLIHRRSIDAVYMSGSPYHPFILTSVITGLYKIPTILDFRDSWSMNHGFDGRFSDPFSARLLIYSVIEKISIRFASSVIFTTSVLQEEYEAAYPLFKEKYVTITNGFDEDDFKDIEPKRVFTGKTLIMTGKFYTYTPKEVDLVMQCLREMKDIYLVYRGDEFEIIQNAAKRAGVEGQVNVRNYQPYSDVLNLIAGSEVGLVTTGLKNGLGTKIFDYLALGMQTVCLIPPDSVISRELGHLPSVIISHAPHSLEKIKNGLQKAFEQNKKKEIVDLYNFTRRRSAKQLAELLDRLCM